MAYAITEVVKDGPVTAPRWFFHCLRVMLALSAFVGLLCLHLEPVIAGVSAAVSVQGIAMLREHFWPDPEPLTPWAHVTDLLTDSACSAVPIVAGLAIDRQPLAYFVAVIIVGAYTLCHHGARP